MYRNAGPKECHRGWSKSKKKSKDWITYIGRGNPLHYSCLENPHGQRSPVAPGGHDWATKQRTHINAYMRNLENLYTWSYWQSRNRGTGIENKYMDTKAERRGDGTGRLRLRHIYPIDAMYKIENQWETFWGPFFFNLFRFWGLHFLGALWNDRSTTTWLLSKGVVRPQHTEVWVSLVARW